jgi:hypothetical protein
MVFAKYKAVVGEEPITAFSNHKTEDIVWEKNLEE